MLIPVTNMFFPGQLLACLATDRKQCERHRHESHFHMPNWNLMDRNWRHNHAIPNYCATD